MKETRKNPTYRQKARLLQEARSQCSFCAFADSGRLEFHHIDENPSNTIHDNLIAVCPNCHSAIGEKTITFEEVIKRKEELKNNFKMKEDKPISSKIKIIDSTLNQPVIGDNNTVNINIKKSAKLKYPEGTLGYETNKANYVSYLITRYHEYKEYSEGKENMRYGIFPSQLKKHFKIGATRTIYNLPIEKFDELIELIQTRIDKTELARKKGKEHKNYSTFEEYNR